MTTVSTHRCALMSACRLYRYDLVRARHGDLDTLRLGDLDPTLLWIMLNPSTADHTVDDPTVRECMKHAWRLGYPRTVICNLFALRSSDPRDLKYAKDPVGPYTDNRIREWLPYATLVIAAWGNGLSTWPRMGERIARVRTIVELAGRELHCLEQTRSGAPKHPLARGRHRIAPDAKPTPWNP